MRWCDISPGWSIFGCAGFPYVGCAGLAMLLDIGRRPGRAGKLKAGESRVGGDATLMTLRVLTAIWAIQDEPQR